MHAWRCFQQMSAFTHRHGGIGMLRLRCSRRLLAALTAERRTGRRRRRVQQEARVAARAVGAAQHKRSQMMQTHHAGRQSQADRMAGMSPCHQDKTSGYCMAIQSTCHQQGGASTCRCGCRWLWRGTWWSGASAGRKRAARHAR